MTDERKRDQAGQTDQDEGTRPDDPNRPGGRYRDPEPQDDQDDGDEAGQAGKSSGKRDA